MNLKSCNKVETNRYQLEVEVDERIVRRVHRIRGAQHQCKHDKRRG